MSPMAATRPCRRIGCHAICRDGSGRPDPSPADKTLTRSLREALALVDIAVLDHFIVAGRERPLSFAESGLL